MKLQSKNFKKRSLLSLIVVITMALTIFQLPVTNVYGEENTYISDIAISARKTAAEAKWDLINNGYTVLNTDLNYGASGDIVYLGYKTTTDANKAIVELYISTQNEEYITKNAQKCYRAPYFGNNQGDINSNTSGVGLRIYYRNKNSDVDYNRNLLSKLGVRVVQTVGLPSALPLGCTDWLGIDDISGEYDLNYGAGGDYIYLAYATAEHRCNSVLVPYSETQHMMRCSECSYIAWYEDHTKYIVDGVCTRCGYSCDEHQWENGICTKCGLYDEPVCINDIYQIESYGNLVWFERMVNDGKNINAVITNDIVINENLLDEGGNLTGTPKYVWTPIGIDAEYNNAFSGTLDGQGHSISGIYTNSENHNALFACLNGTVKNIIIKDSYFGDENKELSASFTAYAGTDCVIENCGSSAYVNGSSMCGGISALTNGTIKNCYFNGKINSASEESDAVAFDKIGEAVIENCYYLSDCGKTSAKANEATEEQFESGEVCYKLNNGVTNGTQVWRQTIGIDKAPVFSGGIVYYGYASCSATEKTYSNLPVSDTKPHEYVNGICSVCGDYEKPVITEGVYQISNYGNLVWFGKAVDSGDNSDAVVTADIIGNTELLDENGNILGKPKYKWNPICKSVDNVNNAYSGTFDGQKHTISGLYAPDTEKYCGLFAKLNGKVKYIIIKDSYFGSSDCSYVGSVAGEGGNNCNIESCGSRAIVNGREFCGGIVGLTNGKIINSYFSGILNSDDITSNAIASDLSYSIEDCYYLDSCKNSNKAIAKSNSQFTSGEVCYLLNGDQSSILWYQTIGSDDTPMFSGKQVYSGYSSCESVEREFSNTKFSDTQGHNFVNDICTKCGTGKDPEKIGNIYQIASYGNLIWLQRWIDLGNANTNAVLISDITANSNLVDDNGNVNGTPEYKWTPIAKDTSNTFKGVFDGQGYTISGLYIPESDNDCALFANSDGTIKNMRIIDSYFSGGENTASILANGDENSVIENCSSNAVIKGTYYCGGIAGDCYGTIKDCYYNGKISADNSTSNSISSDFYENDNIINCYYLDSCGLNSDRAVSKAVESFESGEVCYLLNNGVTDGTQSWYQTLDYDTEPKLKGKTVYFNENSNPQYYNDILMGDVDDNGVVNKVDAALVLRHTSTIELLDNKELSVADMNSDGIVNLLDVIEILNVNS